MKFCGNCGAQLEDSAHYCTYCGTRFEGEAMKFTPTDAQSTQQHTEQHTEQTKSADSQIPTSRKTNGFAVAGFVLGLVSIVLTWCFCFPITPILGIVFSSMALSQIAKSGDDGKGIAVAGLIISIICIILLFLFFVAGITAGIFDNYRYYDYYEGFEEFFSSI